MDSLKVRTRCFLELEGTGETLLAASIHVLYLNIIMQYARISLNFKSRLYRSSHKFNMLLKTTLLFQNNDRQMSIKTRELFH